MGSSADRLFTLTPRQLMGAVADYASAHGEGSRRWFQSSLRSLFEFCHLRGYMDTDLREWIPSFRRPRLASIPKAIPDDLIVRLQSGGTFCRTIFAWNVQQWHSGLKFS